MAKAEGEQSIPAELLDGYRATLGEQKEDGTVEKRYPFRVPTSQAGKAGETPTRKAQRAKFLSAVAKFNALPQAARQRWYARMPPWSSLLWYYNWFMLNAIPNLWQAVPGGDAILNNIQVIKTTLGTGGGLVNIPTEVIATQCVVMLQGASYKFIQDQVGDYPYAYAWPIYPMLSAISNTQIDLRWAITPQAGALVSATIIEYI